MHTLYCIWSIMMRLSNLMWLKLWLTVHCNCNEQRYDAWVDQIWINWLSGQWYRWGRSDWVKGWFYLPQKMQGKWGKKIMLTGW
jgi:hypothetical protein